MIVKICGITSVDDAVVSLEAGADMLGFNFYEPSPRYIDPKRCYEIVQEIQRRKIKFISVGIFVNHHVDEVTEIIDYCCLDLAQLSGDETIESLHKLRHKGVKSIRPKNLFESNSIINTLPSRKAPPQFILDANSPGAFGGTGQLANWALARNLSTKYQIMLAGGLTPENVGQAINYVRPWGVDTASGVELSPGIKDRTKI